MDAQKEWQNIVAIFTDLENEPYMPVVDVPNKTAKRKFKALMGQDSSDDDESSPQPSTITPKSYFGSVLNPSEDEKLSDELNRVSVVPVSLPLTLKKRKKIQALNESFLSKVPVANSKKAVQNLKPLPPIPSFTVGKKTIKEEIKEEPVALGEPNEFKVQMREGYHIKSWQAEAVRWVNKVEAGEVQHQYWKDESKQGGILALEVGLGKTCVASTITLQSLAFQRRFSSCTLYVTEKNLMVQMIEDVKLLFGNQMKCLCVHRDYMNTMLKKVDKALIQEYDIVVTNYHTLSTMFNMKNMEPHCIAMRTFKWYRVFLDESHNIRNHTTQLFKNLLTMECPRRWCMTGTPIHNTLRDLTNQLTFTGCDFPPGKCSFKQFEAMGVDKRILFMKKTYAAELGMQLPKRNIDVIFYDLSKEERYLHDHFKNQAKAFYFKTLTDIGKDAQRDHSHMISSHLRSLQVCSAPYLVTPQSKIRCSDNMVTLDEAVTLPKDHNMENWVQDELGAAGVGSSKMVRMLSLISELRTQYISCGEKFKLMIYANHTSTLHLAYKALCRSNGQWANKCLMVHGQSGSAKKRNIMYDQFRNDDNIEILFMTLKSGCAGLNFQRTCHLQIHLETWHSFASHSQAMGRVYRLGQLNDVQIYFLIAKDSSEERVYNVCMDKKELAEDVSNLQERDTSAQGMPMEDILL